MLFSETMWLTLSMTMLACIFMFNKTHLMGSLIIIECMSMMVLILSFIFIKSISMENFFTLYMLIILLMESTIGLSILMSMMRTHSNDYIKTLTIMKL